MFRVCTLLLFALVLTATGCETGSTHENLADRGLSGQNVGESGKKAGPVPGSATGTDATAYTSPEPPQTPKPAPASAVSSVTPSGAPVRTAAGAPAK